MIQLLLSYFLKFICQPLYFKYLFSFWFCLLPPHFSFYISISKHFYLLPWLQWQLKARPSHGPPLLPHALSFSDSYLMIPRNYTTGRTWHTSRFHTSMPSHILFSVRNAHPSPSPYHPCQGDYLTISFLFNTWPSHHREAFAALSFPTQTKTCLILVLIFLFIASTNNLLELSI